MGLPTPRTTTERNWLVALAIVLGSVVVFALFQRAEEAARTVGRSARLVWNPSETSMRLLALSHFLVAFVFMATSRRMKTTKSWLQLGALGALGALLCVGLSRLGGLSAPVGAVLFYAYFLVHEFRDETGFCRAWGEMPTLQAGEASWTAALAGPLIGVGLIASLFGIGVAFGIGGARRFATMYSGVPVVLRAGLGLLPAALTAWGLVALSRRGDGAGTPGLRAAWRANRPLFFIGVGTFVVLVADILVTGRVYAIVTLHVTAWYVFAVRRLKSLPAPAGPARAGSFRWVKTTPQGFVTFHLAMLALVIAAAAVWAYGFSNDGQITGFKVLLSREAFPYWTVVHVTLSWLPAK